MISLMNAVPFVDEQALVFLNDGKGHTQIPFLHAPVRQHSEIKDIDAGLALPVNVDVRRLVVIGVDDKSHASSAQGGDHDRE